jgi:penicillin amidase
MSEMITDVTSSVSPSVIKEFTSIIDLNSFTKNEQKAINILKNWDGSNTLKAIAPTIYNKWVYLYLKNTFEDEMGETLFTQFLKTHLAKKAIANQIKKDSSIWWDNVTTSTKIETKKDILSKSLVESVSFLENQLGSDISTWNWEKVNSVEHPHPLGTISYLRKYFNVGPFPINGAREVLNNRAYEYDDSGLYKATMGPSTRRIIDFSDVENSISILPTGQSGNPFSEHYRDQAEMYNKGEFRKMKMNKEEIIKVSTKLTIQAKNE